MYIHCSSTSRSPLSLITRHSIPKRQFSYFEKMFYLHVFKVEDKNIGVVKDLWDNVIRIEKKPGWYFYNTSLLDLIYKSQAVDIIPKKLKLKIFDANARDITNKVFAIANGVFEFQLTDLSIAADISSFEMEERIKDRTVCNLKLKLQTIRMEEYVAEKGETIKKSFTEKMDEETSDLGYRLEKL